MIKDYIRKLCKDEDAKGTLKRERYSMGTGANQWRRISPTITLSSSV